MNSSTHFLIVDDYSNIRTLVKSQLKEFGIQENITEAEYVDQAIEKLEAAYKTDKKVEFIISDWNMPNKTGFEFLKWVRADQRFKDLPFLLLTTLNEQDKVMEAITNGVSNFLLKPWEEEDLKEKIAQCWKKHH